MSIFLVLAFLFYIGSLSGWVLELFWRRFFSKNNPSRKWINPGFLVGPYLPLYGFSLCTLFLLSFIKVPFVESPVLQKIILFCFMALCVTIIEFIAGLIFINGMKIKLWDYSNCPGNIMGIVCPQYSIYWFILCALYYFIIHPQIIDSLYWLADHISFSFFIGFFYGVFVIDLSYSLHLLTKIRKFAKENQVVLRIEHFKTHVCTHNDQLKNKIHFFLSFKSDSHSLSEVLKSYIEKK